MTRLEREGTPADHNRDTIFAVSTAPGRAAIAIVRLSGPGAGDILVQLTRRDLPAPRRARRACLMAPQGGEAAIDDALTLWFPGPHSFTGEDMAEFHVHGSRAVLLGLTEALASITGTRPAEGGEFTRRAFDNARMDLSEVEGLADLIAAETEAQRRQALRQMAGGLSEVTEAWRNELLHGLALVEADLDFPDEDLPVVLESRARQTAGQLMAEIAAHLGDDRRGERLREGVSAVIFGPPNAGKSSLLNLLARREAAIVAETAGTTRDVIEVHLDLGGFPVTVADTAGLRLLDDGEGLGHGEIEKEGMRRARTRIAGADLKIAVFNLVEWPELEPESLVQVDSQTLVVLNKRDLAAPPSDLRTAFRGASVFPLSVKTGEGMDAFMEAVEAMVRRTFDFDAAAPPVITRARHRAALRECHESLARSLEAQMPELVAEDLRLAARALGRIAGRVDVEDVLDVVFREFCIGK